MARFYPEMADGENTNVAEKNVQEEEIMGSGVPI
jgi:hypothetical protein